MKIMTEKEKAARGIPYDPNHDEALIAERLACANLCFDYNNLPPGRTDQRRKLLGEILGKTGERLEIIPPFHCDYGYNIEIGEDFYANYNCIILDAAKVTFGDHVFIAPNCGFYAASHPLDVTRRNQGLEYAKPITIGNNVWIGGGVTVLPGVVIGDNSVIGAGSVVTEDIPSGVVAVGNPCRVVKRID